MVAECRKYIAVKDQNKRARYTNGETVYLLSKNWLRKYKEYVLYSDVKRNNKPTQPEVDKHPGPITNDEDLCEKPETKLLLGTGTVFDANTADKYIRDDVRERYEFKIVNQEFWEFLHSRYGGSIIKRAANSVNPYSTTVEVRLKRLTVVLLPTL